MSLRISKSGDAYTARDHGAFRANFDRRERAKVVDKYVAPGRVRIAGTPPRLSGGKMPIAKLIEFLKKARTPDDKLLALSALRSRGVDAVVAVPHLIRMIHDPSSKVQKAVTDLLIGLCSSRQALDKMRHIKGLVSALKAIAEGKGGWELKSFALKILVKISTPAEAVDILMFAVTNDEWRICTDALFYMRSKPILAAIKASGQEKAIANIISHFLDYSRSPVRKGVVKMLSLLGGAAKASEARLLKQLGAEKEGGIRLSIARLLGALNKDAAPSVRVNAIGKALAKVASGDKDWAVRAGAAQALGQMGHAVAGMAVPALIDLIVDGRREMARIKGTCMELSNECDRRTDKFFDAMTKAEQTIRGRMGGGRVVWKELIKLWSHDDELVRYYSARLWANMFWNSNYRNLPK